MPRGVALVAVGGYGRGQLFPHSDVDVLILLPAGVDPAPSAQIERFLAALWDIGLEVGHAVRTVDDCEREMAGDVTVRTSLLENRLLAGSRKLHAASANASPPRSTLGRSTRRRCSSSSSGTSSTTTPPTTSSPTSRRVPAGCATCRR